jgi:CubicO group peptidase (beta-lactamase class C family)
MAVRLAARLDEKVPQWMQEMKVPGLSLAIIEGGKLARQSSFGVTDAESREPINSETIFTSCSMAKPVFAYFALKLCDRGILHLDTPLTKYTPEKYLEGDSRLELVTARHVLSHTTGFQNWREEDGKPLRIHFTPGEKWSYSGEGYSYLGQVITRLMGKPFEEYMHEQLLNPFRMSSSSYIWTEGIGQRMARPHAKDGGVMASNKKPTHESVARYGPAGDLLTTVGDYSKFLIETLEPKPADEFRLSRQMRNEMLRSQVKAPDTDPPSEWALGWQKFHDRGLDLIGHGGMDSGWRTVAFGVPANKCGYVAMTNSENGSALLARLLLFEATQEFLRG